MRVVVVLGSLLLASIGLLMWWLGDAAEGARERGPAPLVERGAEGAAQAPEMPRPVVVRDEPAREPTPAPPTPVELAQPSALVPPPSSSVAPARFPTCALRVVVLDARTEQPLPDAGVRISFWTRGSNRRELDESGRTDAAGVCTFEVDPGTLSVVAFRTGEAYARASVEVPAGVREHELRMTLDETHTLRGVVLDDARRPIAGAAVYSRTAGGGDRFACTTDAWGRFGLPWWLVDGATSLDIEREGYGAERLEWEFADGEWWYATSSERAPFHGDGDQLEVTLRATRRVVGTLVDAQGTPAAGARVELQGSLASGRRMRRFDYRIAFTDLLGRFEVEALRIDTAYVVVARQEGQGVAVREVPAGGDVDLGEVELVSFVPVSGRLVDGVGLPLDHASVELEFTAAEREDAAGRAFGSLVPTAAKHGFVDAEGRFEVHGAALPDLRLTVYLHGAEVLTRELDLSAGGLELGDLVVVQGVHAFSGTVLDLDGEPVAHVWLHVRDVDRVLVAQARTDAGGHFSFALPQFDVPPAVLRLTLYRLGNTTWTARSFGPGEFPVTLRVDRNSAER